MTTQETLPAWLKITDDGAVITLKTPSMVCGITMDQVTMRAPTIKDVRAARKVGGDDEDAADDVLFASLIGASKDDVEGLKVWDYNRINKAYFRLVRDDGL